MEKKGELSINVIVMAVVALLVLIVLAILLIRNGSKAEQTAQNCDNVKGHIPGGKSCPEGETHYIIGDTDQGWCCVNSDDLLKTSSPS